MDNKRPLGITIFGITNVIISLIFWAIYFVIFVYAVLIGLVTDSGFQSPYDWFCGVIIYRLSIATSYVLSFILLQSGIFMLLMKPASRKLAIITSIVITIAQISSLPFYPWSIWNLIPIAFLFYTILLTIYLNIPDIKKKFNDSNVKLSFKKPILIILIAFIFPLIFRGIMYLWIRNK